MKTEDFCSNISFGLFILASGIVLCAIIMMIADYFIRGLFIGWSAGIYFFILLGLSSFLIVVAVPFSLVGIKRKCEKKWKATIPMYPLPLCLLYLLIMGLLVRY